MTDNTPSLPEADESGNFWLKHYQVVVDGIVNGKPVIGLPLGSMYMTKIQAADELLELRKEFPGAYLVWRETLFDLKSEDDVDEYVQMKSAIDIGAKSWRQTWKALPHRLAV